MEKTPIQILAEALAEMTCRAVEAERQLAEEKASADTWYKSYNNLKAEYEKLKKTVEELQADYEKMRKEATELVCKKEALKENSNEEGGAYNEPF